MSEIQSAGGSDGVDVQVIGPDQRDTHNSQTPSGLRRSEAVSNKLTGSKRMWMGYAVLDPGGMTGVQQHGESETAIYILGGVTRWLVGDRRRIAEARAGDFVSTPSGIGHWEQNASDTAPIEMVVPRSTQEAIVVAVKGHPFAPPHAHRDDRSRS